MTSPVMFRQISLSLACAVAVLPAQQAFAQAVRSGNPVIPGWYADPEAHVFGGRYWIYPTYSAPYNQQTFMDAFSSPDLITWEKHSRVLDIRDVKWARRALWAWRGSRGWFGRLWSTVLAASFLFLLWFGVSYRLVGFELNY